VAETVKERLMKRYKSEMVDAAEKQREREQRRAARPIIALLVALFLSVVVAVVRGLLTSSSTRICSFVFGGVAHQS
jgi:hypothetical protein